MTAISDTAPIGTLRDLLTRVRPVKTNFDLIRLGSKNDGGYLVPDDLDGIVACFSPGVSRIANFELDMTKRGIPCFLADYSVDSPPIANPLFHFEKKFLGVKDEAEFITLEDWVSRNAPPQGDMILQMDIEGAEYPVLSVASAETLRRFRIIVIELHFLRRLFDPKHFATYAALFAQLLADFDCVHIHPNNCCGEVIKDDISLPKVAEFTFLRKDRIAQKEFATVFPHPLDTRNVIGKPDLALPNCWFAAPAPTP